MQIHKNGGGRRAGGWGRTCHSRRGSTSPAAGREGTKFTGDKFNLGTKKVKEVAGIDQRAKNLFQDDIISNRQKLKIII